MTFYIYAYLPLFIYPIAAFLLTLVLTRGCISLLPKLGYVDKPGGRHIHKKSIPRGGGIAIFIAFFLVLWVYSIQYLPNGIPSMDKTISNEGYNLLERLFYPGIILVGLGLIDDRFGLKSWVKLIVQIVVAMIVWFLGQNSYYLFGYLFPWYVGLGVTIVWVIIIVNAFNLIDGLDGLASGLAVVSSVCLAVWFMMNPGHRAEAVILFVLAACCIGFLVYNFSPAKIFLGDTGSTFLGLVFAVIGLSTHEKTVTFTSLFLPALAVGVPLFDVGLAIWRRGIRKLLDPKASGIMSADQDHLHHRLLRETKKQSKTAIRMYILASFFGTLALVAISMRCSISAVGYIIVLVIFLMVIHKMAGIELLDSVSLIRNSIHRPHSKLLIHITHPFIDLCVIFISYLIVCKLSIGVFNDDKLLITMIAPTMAILLISGIYRIYWLRAGSENYMHLAISIFFGSAFSCIVLYVFCADSLWNQYAVGLNAFIKISIMFTTLNLTGIYGERFLLHYIEWYWLRMQYLKNQEQQGHLRKSLIYGGGLKCRLYVNYLYSARMGNIKEEIIGILDDNKLLRGLCIYNFEVFGGGDDLEEVWKKNAFNKLVLAITDFPNEKIQKIKQFCDKRNIEFVRFNVLLENIGITEGGEELKIRSGNSIGESTVKE